MTRWWRSDPSQRGSTNRDLLRLTSAYGLTAVGEWALWLAVLVYAYDAGGAAATGYASLALVLPVVAVAPFTGRAAGGSHPTRLMSIAYGAQAIGLGAAALAALADAPWPVVVGCSALAVGAVAAVRPTCAVVLPSLVRTARDLTSANVRMGRFDSLSVLFGPLLAGALLTAQGPALALAVCSALNLLGFVITAPLSRRADTPVHQPEADHPAGPVRTLMRQVRSLGGRGSATSVLVIAGAQYVLVGALDLATVVYASEVLQLDESGPALLAAAVGVGAVAAGLGARRVVGRGRLAPVVLLSVVAISVSMVVVGTLAVLAVVLPVLAIIGFSRSSLDLTTRMLLQRSAPPTAVAAVFSVLELFAAVGTALGLVVTQVVIAVADVRVALIVIGGMFAVIALATFRQLRSADDSANVPVVAIGLLRRLPVFALLPPAALEAVARAASERPSAPGEVVVREGDDGHLFYAVAAGSFVVDSRGNRLRTLHRGDSFGEIALLADVPRTATVTAIERGELLSIDRVAFLTAVTGHDASRQAALGALRTLVIDADVAQRLHGSEHLNDTEPPHDPDQ